ncbi:ParG protein [Amycolatopsis australiensis]|uniref:ParG protein n=2 Tax=Amycolatopsis australiensis TaxID=546364 RepID=A0A1K1LPN6_9PSEU|nr:ParG protein [Amycolatopsis australiensis]
MAMGRPRLGRTANVDVPVTPELKQEFQDACNEAGRSMTDVANELFALWVAQRQKAPKQQPLPLMDLKKAS